MSHDALSAHGSSLSFVTLLFRRLVHGFAALAPSKAKPQHLCTASHRQSLGNAASAASGSNRDLEMIIEKFALNASQLQEVVATWPRKQQDGAEMAGWLTLVASTCGVLGIQTQKPITHEVWADGRSEVGVWRQPTAYALLQLLALNNAHLTAAALQALVQLPNQIWLNHEKFKPKLQGQLLQALHNRASGSFSVSAPELSTVMDLYWSGLQCPSLLSCFAASASAAAPDLALAFFASRWLAGDEMPGSPPLDDFVHSFVRLYQAVVAMSQPQGRAKRRLKSALALFGSTLTLMAASASAVQQGGIRCSSDSVEKALVSTAAALRGLETKDKIHIPWYRRMTRAASMSTCIQPSDGLLSQLAWQCINSLQGGRLFHLVACTTRDQEAVNKLLIEATEAMQLAACVTGPLQAPGAASATTAASSSADCEPVACAIGSASGQLHFITSGLIELCEEHGYSGSSLQQNCPDALKAAVALYHRVRQWQERTPFNHSKAVQESDSSQIVAILGASSASLVGGIAHLLWLTANHETTDVAGAKPWPAFEAALQSGAMAVLEQWSLDPSPGTDPVPLLEEHGSTVCSAVDALTESWRIEASNQMPPLIAYSISHVALMLLKTCNTHSRQLPLLTTESLLFRTLLAVVFPSRAWDADGAGRLIDNGLLQALWTLPIRASAAAELEVLQDLLTVLCSAFKDVIVILPEVSTRLLGPRGLYDWETVLETVELAAPSVVGTHAWSSCKDLAAMLENLTKVDFTAALGKAAQQLYTTQQSEQTAPIRQGPAARGHLQKPLVRSGSGALLPSSARSTVWRASGSANDVDAHSEATH